MHAQKTARNRIGSVTDRRPCGDVKATLVKPFWDLCNLFAIENIFGREAVAVSV